MAVNTLISVEELRRVMDLETPPVIIDCRFSLLDPNVGSDAYLAGHLPGALYAHLNDDLSGPIIPGQTGRHPLPHRSEFIDTIQKFGIHNHDTVVAYDGGNGAYAARLWWLLRWLGHDNVFVLDGGIAAWQEAGFSTTRETLKPSVSHFQDSGSHVQIIDADGIQKTTATLIDARDPERFRGEVEPIDPVAGHIPGALNLPFTENLNASGTFKSSKTLKAQFVAAQIPESAPTVCYCGSGVTACHNIIALILAGYEEPMLYPGSWSEWVTDPKRPIATDLARGNATD